MSIGWKCSPWSHLFDTDAKYESNCCPIFCHCVQNWRVEVFSPYAIGLVFITVISDRLYTSNRNSIGKVRLTLVSATSIVPSIFIRNRFCPPLVRWFKLFTQLPFADRFSFRSVNLIQHPNKLYPMLHVHIDGYQIGQQNFYVQIGAMYLLNCLHQINHQCPILFTVF